MSFRLKTLYNKIDNQKVISITKKKDTQVSSGYSKACVDILIEMLALISFFLYCFVMFLCSLFNEFSNKLSFFTFYLYQILYINIFVKFY